MKLRDFQRCPVHTFSARKVMALMWATEYGMKGGLNKGGGQRGGEKKNLQSPEGDVEEHLEKMGGRKREKYINLTAGAAPIKITFQSLYLFLLSYSPCLFLSQFELSLSLHIHI